MSIIEHPNYFTSLPREYYTSQQVYERELELVFRRQWLYAGHVSQLRETGDYFVRDIGPESLIFVRDKQGGIRAFFNVCRHRGSQLCPSGTSGRTKVFVCPYHRWSYGVDGRLLGSPGARDGVDFDFGEWPLHGAHCDVFYGQIWVWLGRDGDDRPPISLEEALLPNVHDLHMLRQVEPERIKIAHQETYIIRANWKLLLENNCECYHCGGAHRALAQTCDYAGFYAAQPGDPEPSDRHFPLRPGMKTFSMDGEWVCKKPLGPGFVPDFSTGYLNDPIFAGPVYFADHGVNLDLAPIDKDTTRLVCQWLVHEDAAEGVDYEVEPLKGVFHVTNVEDGDLAELNQRGVNSSRFIPGPNSSTREPAIRAALNRYLELMHAD